MSATGLGATVDPEENWTRPRLAGAASGRGAPADPSSSSPASRSPNRGRAWATASPSSRRVPPPATTSTASETRSMRAVASRYSSSRPSRTGG